MFESSENLLIDSLQLEDDKEWSRCHNSATKLTKFKPNFEEIDDFLLNDNKSEQKPT